MEEYIKKLINSVEICNANMDSISKSETPKLVESIINILREQRIPNMRANDEEICQIIFNIRKDENGKFTNKLAENFKRHALMMYNPQVDLEKVIESNIVEIRKLLLSMVQDKSFIDSSERIYGEVINYIISKNKNNPYFEHNYYTIKSNLKKMIEKDFTKYMEVMAEGNTNLMIPMVNRYNEELLNPMKESENQLPDAVIF